MPNVNGTLSEQIREAAGSDPAVLDVLEGVTASAAELNILDGATLSTAELNILDGVTATAAELNMAADNSVNCEVVTTTNVITAAESGTTYFLDAAAGFLSTLPAPALGLRYKFVVKTNPTSNGYTIATDASANIIKGSITEATDTAGQVTAVGDLITFVFNVALAGDFVEVISDGTSWFVTGHCAADGGITFAST